MDEFGLLDLQPFSDDDLAPPPAGPMPKGDYHAKLSEVEVREKENGVQLMLLWTDFTPCKDDGNDYSRRRIYQGEWVIHKNEQAQRIGRTRLTQAGKALGLATQTEVNGKTGWALPVVTTVQELHEHFAQQLGAQCTIYVSQRKRSDNGELENTVGSVKPLGSENA